METLSRAKPSKVRFPTYPQTRHIYRPQSEDELENKLQTIHHKFQVTLKALHPQQKWWNIDDTDKKNFKELKGRP